MKAQTNGQGRRREYEETIWLLEEWARWSRINSAPSLTLPSVTPYRRLQGATLKSPVIDDDTAMMVDNVIARLIQRDEETGKAVVMYFRNGQTVSHIARRLRKERWRVDILIRSGTSWLDGALNSQISK